MVLREDECFSVEGEFPNKFLYFYGKRQYAEDLMSGNYQ